VIVSSKNDELFYERCFHCRNIFDSVRYLCGHLHDSGIAADEQKTLQTFYCKTNSSLQDDDDVQLQNSPTEPLQIDLKGTGCWSPVGLELLARVQLILQGGDPGGQVVEAETLQTTMMTCRAACRTLLMEQWQTMQMTMQNLTAMAQSDSELC
jgi:hypothetical protein